MALRTLSLILLCLPELAFALVLRLEGPVDGSWLERFEEVQDRVTRIELNSAGGLQAIALEIAQRMQARGRITTVVLSPEDRCESACVTIFMAGTRRVAHPESRFLLHGVSYPSHNGLGNYGFLCVPHRAPGCEELAESSREYIRSLTHEYFFHLEQFGLSPEVRVKFFSRAYDPDWIEKGNPSQILEWSFPAKELFEFGLKTETKQKKPLR